MVVVDNWRLVFFFLTESSFLCDVFACFCTTPDHQAGGKYDDEEGSVGLSRRGSVESAGGGERGEEDDPWSKEADYY